MKYKTLAESYAANFLENERAIKETRDLITQTRALVLDFWKDLKAFSTQPANRYAKIQDIVKNLDRLAAGAKNQRPEDKHEG